MSQACDLVVNALIEEVSEAEVAAQRRVLWLEAGGNAVVIDVRDPHAMPYWLPQESMREDLASGRWRVLEHDPYLPPPVHEDELSSKRRRRRAERWKVIAAMVEDPERAIFSSDFRGGIVRNAAAEHGVSPTSVYGWLRRYWQGGQSRNARLPEFDRCGGPGRERRAGIRKRGRPSQLAKSDPHKAGVNITPHIRHLFDLGVKKFYERKQTKGGRSLNKTWLLTLRHYFNLGYTRDDRSGALIEVLPPAHELPTLRQFKYWYYKEHQEGQRLTKRHGARWYNLRRRPLLGSGTSGVDGPGARWQIDSTIADILLLSTVQPGRIIGRPTVYIVVDVFTFLIVGYYAGFENANWIGMMMALEQAMTDKVAHCSQYGIGITEQDWPVHHLPEVIFGDRAELLSKNADQLANALGIEVSNAAPYRADWKPYVERCFRLLNDDAIHWMPGAVHRRERGDPANPLDATLDLRAFNKLLVQLILYHNESRRLERHAPDPQLIRDGVEPYPINFWRWGIENRSGHLRPAPNRDRLRVDLLPVGSAIVTRRGIRLNGLHYTCPRAETEGWFDLGAGMERSIPGSHDPRDVGKAFLRLEGGRDILECTLAEKDRHFAGHTLEEVRDYRRAMRLDEAAVTRTVHDAARLEANVEAIVREAVEGKAALVSEVGPLTADDMRQGRGVERREHRRQDAWTAAPGSEPDHAAAPDSDDDGDEDAAPADDHALLRAIRERRSGAA